MQIWQSQAHLAEQDRVEQEQLEEAMAQSQADSQPAPTDKRKKKHSLDASPVQKNAKDFGGA